MYFFVCEWTRRKRTQTNKNIQEESEEKRDEKEKRRETGRGIEGVTRKDGGYRNGKRKERRVTGGKEGQKNEKNERVKWNDTDRGKRTKPKEGEA